MTNAEPTLWRAGSRMYVELSGIRCWVPQKWSSYPHAAKQQVVALVASLVRSGADAFTLIRVTKCDSGKYRLSYHYSMPHGSNLVKRADKRLEGHPRA